ncbi:MAG: helix-turn-helix domain-containing protein [Anaerolineae bacterium]
MTNSTPPTPDWANLADYITADEAAEISGYHVNYIRRLMRAKKLTGRKAGIVWLIERESLHQYLAKVNTLGNRRFGPGGITKGSNNE